MPEDKNSTFLPPRRLPARSETRSVEEQFPLDPLFKFPDSRSGITVLALAKDINQVESSEDACAISSDGTKLAICDGVSAFDIPRPPVTR